MKQIKSFLVFCSGADRELLKECPESEIIKYASIGATVFFTGLLASFSGGYALFTIFKDESFAGIISFFFAIIWGLMIFNLDRYIVSSMRKKEKFNSEFKLAIPRIILAIIIALVISKPIEVRIFNNAIETALDQRHRDLALANDSFAARMYHQQDYADSYKDYALKENQLQQESGNDPVTDEFRQLVINKNAAESNYNAIQAKNIAQIRNEATRAAEIKKRRTITRFENGVSSPYLPSDAQNAIVRINSTIKSLNSEINTALSKYEALKEKSDFIRDSTNADIKSRLKTIKIGKDSVGRIKVKIDSAATAIALVNDSLENKHGTDVFINRIQILGEITKVPFSTFWWTGWLITLLFLSLEMAPILVKLLSDKGAYDEKYETENKKIKKLNETERKINDYIAENDYYSSELLVKRLELNKSASKKALVEIITIVSEKSFEDKKFDEVIEALYKEASLNKNETQKEGREKYVTNVIEFYDKASNYLINSIKKLFDF